MIEEKESLIRYLDEEGLRLIHAALVEAFKEDGEPIPPFSMANENNLDALIKAPQSNYFGIEQYPNLESKAAILFYTLNKKHLFLNANKRMSVLCLLVFLAINNAKLKVGPDELTKKALWLAETTHDNDFMEVKIELEEWIKAHINVEK